MKINDFEELKERIRNYIQLLEKEYDCISEILCFDTAYSSLSLKEMEIMRYYRERIEQIDEILRFNYNFLEWVEFMEKPFICADPKIDLLSDIEIDRFISETDPLKLTDEDDLDVTGVEFTASDSTTPISEAITETDREKSDISTADAIANLEGLLQLKKLTDEDELTVNSYGRRRRSLNIPFKDAILQCEPMPVHMSLLDIDDTYVSTGKSSGGYGMCRICGKVFNQTTNYCPECGTKVVIEKPVVTLDKVQFSAVAPKTFVKGDYSVIEIMMYEEGFQHVVQDLIANADESVKETKSGVMTAEREAKITIVLSSPDLEITDNTESHIWQGGYLNFSFAVEVPEEYAKRQILFVASVYINDIIATRLKFVAKCKTLIEQKMEITREDILSAFVSYASQDRKRVARIIQGMKKARPDMDIFFDVESLRSGDDWKKKIRREIDKKDILFLCWSKYARDSEWVDYEWRSALKIKGADSIEPIPIEPPESCPPPDELGGKHFNDKLLYIINSNPSGTSDELTACYDDIWE